MDFSFDDGQELFKRSARKFLETYCDKSTVTELEDSESGFSPELWKGMAELGWMGVLIPSEYGGLESSLLELAVLFEEVGRAAMSGPLLETVTAALCILDSGTAEQKGSLLPRIAQGELVLTLAIAEPEVNYDPSMISARAVREDSRYVIQGTKRFVPYASVSDYLLVAARTSGMPGGETGITIFIVDRETPGIRFSPMSTLAPNKQFDVHLDAVSVSHGDVLGEVDAGCRALRKVDKTAAALQCAEMVGGAQKELEMTADYAKVRHQFDRPIGSFQAVQHRIADMFIDVNGARLAAYKALWCLSQGVEADWEVSVAKYFTNKASQRVAFSAQQLHGGIGVSLEYDLHFYYRRAKAFELKFGPQALHLGKLGEML
jgi:alkylation response protein AidB-like acyl-CoA dehydrogenase